MTAREKYLTNYAEPEYRSASELRTYFRSAYSFAVVIPAYDETIECVERLRKHPRAGDFLPILVINQPDTLRFNENNETLFNTLVTQSSQAHAINNVYLVEQGEFEVLVVERFFENHRIPEKQGVGLARKIGVDVACGLHRDNILLTDWVFNTDADAHLPNNYFDIDTTCNSAGIVFDFEHINGDTRIACATRLYEKALKYYRKGLRWAGSPYAFYTLGSTLAVNIQSYSHVRGFPKRAGAEDFYLLNKLAKIGPIDSVDEICVKIDARFSDRVPFGTGPAVKSISELTSPQEDYRYYNPQIFEVLKVWLDWISNDFPCTFFNNPNALTLPSTPMFSVAYDVALKLGFANFIEHAIKQCGNEHSLITHFNSWFDGFKTLKFVHTLQSSGYEDCPLATCLSHASQWTHDKSYVQNRD